MRKKVNKPPIFYDLLFEWMFVIIWSYEIEKEIVAGWVVVKKKMRSATSAKERIVMLK